MKTGIIYLITNKVNGKKYVGQTVKTLKKRSESMKALPKFPCSVCGVKYRQTHLSRYHNDKCKHRQPSMAA